MQPRIKSIFTEEHANTCLMAYSINTSIIEICFSIYLAQLIYPTKVCLSGKNMFSRFLLNARATM